MSSDCCPRRIRKITARTLGAAFPEKKAEIAGFNFAALETFDGSRIRKLIELFMENPDTFYRIIKILIG